MLKRKEKNTYSTTKSIYGTLWLDILIRKRSGGNQFKKDEGQKVLWYRGIPKSQTIVPHAEIIWELPSTVGSHFTMGLHSRIFGCKSNRKTSTI